MLSLSKLVERLKELRFVHFGMKRLVISLVFFASSSFLLSESSHRGIGPSGLSIVGTNNEISNLGNEIQGHVFPNDASVPVVSSVGEMRAVVQIFGDVQYFPHISGLLTFHQLPVS